MSTPALEQLERLAHELGGSLRSVPNVAFEQAKNHTGFSHNPFAQYRLGLFHKTREVLWCRDDQKDVTPLHVIHEMAHVFASPQDPRDLLATEFEFLGWELAVHKHIGIGVESWLANIKDYKVKHESSFYFKGYGYVDVQHFSPLDQVALIEERLTAAQTKGLIGPNHEPLSIRT